MAVKKVSIFKDRLIGVKPIIRRKGNLMEGHDSEFINDGATHRYCVPLNARTNSLVDPLEDYTEAQKRELAEALSIDMKRFNVRDEECYWKQRQVVLEKHGLDLSLNDVDGLVKYLILKSNKDLVSPSYEQRFDKGTYKFALIDKQSVTESNALAMDKKIKAYELFGQINSSSTKMYDFLLVYWLDGHTTSKPSKSFTREQLITEVGTIVDREPVRFVDMLSDDDYDLKVLIQKAVLIGAIRKNDKRYRIQGGETIGTIEQLIEYLDPRGRNQEDYLRIKQIVEDEKV